MRYGQPVQQSEVAQPTEGVRLVSVVLRGSWQASASGAG